MNDINNNSEKTISAYIESIRDRITACKTNKPLPWGQFVEQQHGNEQVGIYGTCGATICLSAHGNTDNCDALEALQSLKDLWNRNEADTDRKKLNQNIRLAWLFLALTFKRGPASNEASATFETLMARTRSDSKLWSDCGDANILTPDKISEISSALILAFIGAAIYSWPKQDQVSSITKIKESAQSLQKRFIDNPGKERPHLRILLSAVVIALGKDTSGSIVRQLKLILQTTEDLGARFTHHLDSIDGRDYIVIPTSLVSSLVLFQPKAPSSLYILAKKTIKAVKNSLDTSPDLFNAGTNRASTLEQGLAVLALHGEQISSKMSAAILPAKIMLGMGKERTKYERSFSFFVIFFMYLPFALALISATPFETQGFAPKALLLAWKSLNDIPKEFTALLLSFATAIISPLSLVKALIRGSRK